MRLRYPAMHIMIGSVVSMTIGRSKVSWAISLRGRFWRSCSVMMFSSPVSLRRRFARHCSSVGA